MEKGVKKVKKREKELTLVPASNQKCFNKTMLLFSGTGPAPNYFVV
jgi:hypothetical protein